MFDVLGDLNWIAILLGSIAFTLLGGIWFAVLFPKAYNRSLGRPEAAKPEPSPLFLAGPAVSCLVVTTTTAILMTALRIDGYGDALLLGLIVGIGYLTATSVTIAINPNFPRPLLYAAISGGYQVVGSLTVVAVLQALSRDPGRGQPVCRRSSPYRSSVSARTRSGHSRASPGIGTSHGPSANA